MSGRPADSPSTLLKKLANVPLFSNVLERQMSQETHEQHSNMHRQSTYSTSHVNYSTNHFNQSGAHHVDNRHRRHSMPNWQPSHTTTHNAYNSSPSVYEMRNPVFNSTTESLHPVRRSTSDSESVNRFGNPPPMRNQTVQSSEDRLYPMSNRKSFSDHDVYEDRVISHLDLESNYMNQARGSGSNRERQDSSRRSSTDGNSSGEQILSFVQRQLPQYKDRHSSSRRASAPVYRPNRWKSQGDQEVFVENDEKTMHDTDSDKGKHGVKRRHYSEVTHGESSNKKIRRSSGSDMTRPKYHHLSRPREMSRRSTSPHPVELPFTLDTLTEEIKEISNANAQSPDSLEKKETLRRVLEDIFKKQFPGCSLHLVGSSVNGFGNKESDADFCLMLSQWITINRLEARNILLRLERLMRFCHFVEDSNVIFATVPIIKFIDSVSKCECDININNIVGIKNTFLLKVYCEVDKRLCPLVMVIKKWAKTHGINDSKNGTLSSYALTLLMIHYLQCGCKPSVLPSLQHLCHDVFSNDNNVTNLMKTDVQKFLQEKSIPRSQNKQSLGELLLGFFQYFASFNWNDYVISVRLGRHYHKGLGNLPRHKYIFIEEPFDSNNVTKTVYNLENFNKIKMKISLAANKLRVSPSLKSII